VRTLVQGDDLSPRPSAAVEITLFRIAQEALTNVAKHARAGHVTISLEGDDVVRLTIADDGVGFEPARTLGPVAQRGWGLINMMERARSLGGDLRVESSVGRGTDVIVEVSR
jgi:signal transduction histidine kinase